MSASRRPHAKLQALPRNAFRFEDGFWAPRLDANRRVSLRHARVMLEREGQLEALRIAAGRAAGRPRGPVFSDSDVYKWTEALCWELGRERDAELERWLDETCELIAAAQAPDGYLNSHFQHAGAPARFGDLRDAHELYCAGHLFQAAVAERRSLGTTRLLEVSQRFVDHLASRFGPGRDVGVPGHPQVEAALVELFRTTGDSSALELARFFIDQRGRGTLGPTPWFFGGIDYHVDRVPVREATDARGHAVRQLYLCAGAADVALETGDAALLEAMRRVHRDLVQTKLHVTGGVGARHQGEAFGEAYELPNARAYCETCAAIANVLFCWRMLLATGAAEYAELVELTLYNAFLAGVSSDGRRYFYVNPLASDGTHRRAEWHGCACCPPNAMRLLSSLDHYVATRSPEGVALQLYANGRLDVSSDDESFRLALDVTTEYPFDGKVELRVREVEGRPLLWLRIPGWCDAPALRHNGRSDPGQARDGYLRASEPLRPGDHLELELELRARRLEAHPRVESCRNALAVARGPLIYCLEEVDVPDAERFDDLAFDPSAPLEPIARPDVGGGVTALGAVARARRPDWGSTAYREIRPAAGEAGAEVAVQLVPYFSWGHRAPGKMQVWLPRAR